LAHQVEQLELGSNISQTTEVTMDDHDDCLPDTSEKMVDDDCLPATSEEMMDDDCLPATSGKMVIADCFSDTSESVIDDDSDDYVLV
jgi:hypothetical protein